MRVYDPVVSDLQAPLQMGAGSHGVSQTVQRVITIDKGRVTFSGYIATSSAARTFQVVRFARTGCGP